MNLVAKEFDGLAQSYEANRLSGWYKAHANLLLDTCGLPPTGTVLDVGCGTGYLLREVAKRCGGLRAVGLDVSPAMIDQATHLAESAGLGNVQFVLADWESMTDSAVVLPDCDVIFCVNTLHYFTDPLSAAERFFSWLKPNGKLYILERDKSGSLLTQVWGWMHREVIRDHVEFYSDIELVRILEHAGFANVSVKQKIRRLFWQKKLYTSLIIIECERTQVP